MVLPDKLANLTIHWVSPFFCISQFSENCSKYMWRISLSIVSVLVTIRASTSLVSCFDSEHKRSTHTTLLCLKTFYKLLVIYWLVKYAQCENQLALNVAKLYLNILTFDCLILMSDTDTFMIFSQVWRLYQLNEKKMTVNIICFSIICCDTFVDIAKTDLIVY